MRSIKFLTNSFLTVIFFFGGASLLSAQIPGIPYQAYIQNKEAGFIPGEQYHDIPMAMANIMLEFDIVNSKGEVEYTERISAKTDKFGLVSTVIGVKTPKSTVVYGSFENIVWDSLKKTMNIRVDLTGSGNNFEPQDPIVLVHTPGPRFTGVTTGEGAPMDTFPENPTSGHIYVDESTGLIYAFNGTNWVKQFGTVDGLSSGKGAPTAANPAVAAPGDIYVNEDNGDIYTFDGTQWIAQPGVSVTTGTGGPSPTQPKNPTGGDIYVDNSTGNIYTYNSKSNTWEVFQSDVVSKDGNNLVKKGSDGLAFIDKSVLETAVGLSSGKGAPTGSSPASPSAGDVYVNEDNGNIYTFDGTEWIAQPGVSVTTGTGGPSLTQPKNPTGGDIYVDNSTGNIYAYNSKSKTWVNQTIGTVTTLADNNDGTYTYTSEDGTTTAFAVTQSGTGDPTTVGVTGAAGDVYIDESTGNIYTHDSAGWEVQTGIVSKGKGAPTGSSLASPSAGDVYVNEDNGNIYTYNGTTWVKQTGSDDQALTYDATTFELTLEDGGTPIDLSALNNSGTDDQIIQTLAYDGTKNELTVAIENGNSKTVSLNNSAPIPIASLPDATTTTNGIVRLAGDFAGKGTTAAAPKVSGIQGTPVVDTAPTANQILVFKNGAWTPDAAPATGTDDQALTYDATAFELTLEDGGPAVDLSALNNSGTDDQALSLAAGTASTTLLNIEDGGTGVTFKAADNITLGEDTATNTITFEVDESKLTNIPVTALPDATTTTKGIVRLAGDLGGTGVTGTPAVAATQASAPIVGGLQGVAVSTDRPSTDQVLAYDNISSSWKPTTLQTLTVTGDHMGNHQATRDLVMGSYGIKDGASTPTIGAAGQILSSTGISGAGGGGVRWIYPGGTASLQKGDYIIADEGTVYVQPSGDVTIMLPDPTNKNGKRITVKRADDASTATNTLAVTSTASAKIDGASTINLNIGYQGFTFEAYSGAWYVVNRF